MHPSSVHLLYGLHPVLAALTFRQRHIERLFVREDWFRDQSSDGLARPWLTRICEVAGISEIPIIPTFATELSKLVNGRAHQGVVLETNQLQISEVTEKTVTTLLSSLKSSTQMTASLQKHHNRPLFLLLDHLTDVMNVGSIFRTAAFFGACAVFLSSAPCVVPSPLVSKLSVGAMESLLFYRITDTLSDLNLLRSAGFLIVGTAGEKSSENLDSRYMVASKLTPEEVGADEDGGTEIIPRPLILALGNESNGLSPEVFQACDLIVRIVGSHESAISLTASLSPVPSSLNVAVAMGILLYQLTSLRHPTEDVSHSRFVI